MKPLRLAESVYRDKVYACWLGKNLGGTFGAPWEGQKQAHSLTFYDPVPSEPLPNDDLDLQLVWLKLLQDRGVRPSPGDLADYWLAHLHAYPWNEYGFCGRNLERGLRPPISGCFENYFVDEMGSPIRSEIWACVAPGDPALAASLAWYDAALDHAGGEGVYGELFWAAVQSAAFVFSDALTLIQIGLAMIPVHCVISRAVRDAVWSYQNGANWEEARERILYNFGLAQPCSAPQNHGFTILGWLYGRDFGERLCAAVNCGYDTDCTAATLGATLGLLGGTAGIPAEWSAPVGDRVILHGYTRDLPAPATLGELTDQTVAVGREMLAQRSAVVELAEASALPEDLLSLLFDNYRAQAALHRDWQSAIEVADGYEVALHYNGEPVLRPGIAKTLGVSVREAERPDVLVAAPARLTAPEDWQVEPAPAALGQQRFTLRAHRVPPRSTVEVTVALPAGERVFSYTVLGPAEAQGFPAGLNVPGCETCGARRGHCACGCA